VFREVGFFDQPVWEAKEAGDNTVSSRGITSGRAVSK